MKKIKLKSPAKINLILEVVKKLPNGFHLIRSVMIKAENLYDEIEISLKEKEKGLKIICDNNSIPLDEKNICWKIAEKFFKKTGKIIGLEIIIKKVIPVSAGLGGGSSNGAALLLALNGYFNEPLNHRQLVKLAADAGKDIPFFLIKERAAYVQGMGEKMKIIKNFPRLNLVIVSHGGEIPTPWAYGKLDGELNFMQDKNRINISSGFIKNMKGNLYNDFEIVAKKRYPIIEILEKSLLSFGAIQASLSGKGPAVFGIFATKNRALKARDILKKYYPKFFIEIG